MNSPHNLLRRALACAAVAALALPAAASAAPDRSFTMTAAAAATAWDGPEAVGSYNPTGDYSVENCSKEAATYCDQTLLHVQSGTPVTLDVAIGAFSNPFADFDLYVYRSNANGTAIEDDDITESTTSPAPSTGLPNGFEESTSIPELEPGYYLVNVVYYTTTPTGSSYHADASVTGATPVAGGSPDPGTGGSPDPGTGGGSPPPPSGQPAPGPAAPGALPFRAPGTLGSARKAKKSRKLAFKVTADQDISGLVVQLLSGKSGSKQKVVATFKAATFAKGSRKITLKLSKKVARKFKKGRYTLAARGTVDGQAQQAAQAVTVKK